MRAPQLRILNGGAPPMEDTHAGPHMHGRTCMTTHAWPHGRTCMATWPHMHGYTCKAAATRGCARPPPAARAQKPAVDVIDQAPLGQMVAWGSPLRSSVVLHTNILSSHAQFRVQAARGCFLQSTWFL